MLKAVWNVLKKIFGIIFIILSPLKRLICRRKRRNSDTLLPLTNHYTIPDDFGQVPSESQNELEAWDSWDTDNQSSNSRGSGYHGNQYSRPRTTSRQESESEPDIDFFQDMAPDIKKQKRILVKKKQDTQTISSSKFAVTSDVPLSTGSELESWDEKGSAWDAVAEEDLSWQAEAALKEKRRIERQERNLEQQKRKQERELHKATKRDGPFSAVRLS